MHSRIDCASHSLAAPMLTWACEDGYDRYRVCRMKNVLYIGGFELPDKNAAAQRVMSNSLLLRDMGFNVSLIGSTKDLECVINKANGFNCSYVKYPRSLFQWLKYITVFVSTEKIFAYQPDYVVLYNFPAIASLLILKRCRKRGIKVFQDITEWESASGCSPREIIRKLDINLRMHYCLKRMDGVIAISRYLYERYRKFTQCIYVPPTVDLTCSKWNRNRELNVGDEVRVVYAGNPGIGNKDKLGVIVDAVKSNSFVSLTIIGITRVQYEHVFGHLSEEHRNISFCGRVSHEEAVKAICDADFQILIRDNTLKNNAGFPTKFVESISCCTPVIATLTSNIGE